MILNGWDPSANEQSEHMFYPTYCEGKPDKACMVRSFGHITPFAG